MVQRRSQIKEKKAGAVDAKGDHLPNISIDSCQYDQQRQARDAQTCADAMRHTGGDLFPQVISGRLPRLIFFEQEHDNSIA